MLDWLRRLLVQECTHCFHFMHLTMAQGGVGFRVCCWCGAVQRVERLQPSGNLRHGSYVVRLGVEVDWPEGDGQTA